MGQPVAMAMVWLSSTAQRFSMRKKNDFENI